MYRDDTDEGTLFTTVNISSVEEMNSYLLDNFPDLNDTSLETIDGLYPKGEQFADHGEYYSATASAYGDLRYICPGIYVSDSLLQYNKPTKNWLYRYVITIPKWSQNSVRTCDL